MAQPKTIVSLYTGAGGLDLGLEAAGFETRVAVEMDPEAVLTLRQNRPWPVIERSILHVSSEELLSVAGLQEGEADLLVGGPPCQPFSKSGYWARGDARRLDDPRATTLEAYLRVLRDVKPRVFVLENVPGIAFAAKSEGLDLLKRTVDSINASVSTRYSFNVALLNAADFGVPQSRERVFIVGQRDGAMFRFPKPTHAAPGEDSARLRLADRQLDPFLTAWDAIGDLEENGEPALRVTGKWAQLLPSIPEGQNYLFHTDRGGGLPMFGWRRRYWSFLLKLAKASPSWTIAAQPGPAIGPFHWTNRKLSAQELCRLQTFPEGYDVSGAHRAIQRQLGNAVPSALAERLGLDVRSQLLDDPAASHQTVRLLPRRRGPTPAPEPVAPVPEKYLQLVGDYAAHPGTGLGFGALARN